MEQKPQNLLLVDDDAVNLDMLAHRLERQGYAVGRASTGREALDYLSNHDADLVLLDQQMADMTGIDVLQSLRQTYSLSDLPVIMITAVSEANTVVTALNVGANDYITKPVDLTLALARVGSQLARHAAERELRARDVHDAIAARAGNDGVWDWNLETNEVYYSKRWKIMLGLAEEEIENNAAEWFSRIHPDDSNRVQHDLEAAVSGISHSFESEHRLQHKDLSWRWVLTRGKATFNESGRAIRLAGSQTDITANRTADPLTNLPNRMLFAERVAAALDRSRREAGYAFAVLLLDIDRFKVINDSLGHFVGDQLLVGVARRLRPIDEKFPATLARIRGDEFGILVDEISSAADATKIARWVEHTLLPPFALEGREVYCSMSIGVAMGPNDTRKAADMLRDADTAMHRAKSLGGGRCEIFDGEMRRRAVERLELETDLRRALHSEQLELHYQPKVDLSDASVMGFEALLRWNHPQRGLVPSENFIRIAEETGMIVALGAWVLEQACRQLRAWQLEYPRTPPFTMSVNVSSRQFRDVAFGPHLQRILRENNLDGRALRLELTETALLDDMAETARVMRELKGIGVGIKIGTGYSSLANLCRLSLDTLKIDRSFVSDMGDGSDGAELVKAVLRLAAGLRLNVTAEGVETREQADLLRRMGCQFAQGFYFFRPAAAAEVAHLLRAQQTCSTTPKAC